jgi:hypothetical protein
VAAESEWVHDDLVQALQPRALHILNAGADAFEISDEAEITGEILEGLLLAAWEALEAVGGTTSQRKLIQLLPWVVAEAVGQAGMLRRKGTLDEKVGRRLHKAVLTLRDALAVVSKKEKRKRDAAADVGGTEAEVSSAQNASLEAEHEMLEDLRDKPYSGFVEVCETPEEIARDEAGETGETFLDYDGELAALPHEFRAERLPRALCIDLGDAGKRAVNRSIYTTRVIIPSFSRSDEDREDHASSAKYHNPSKLEADVRDELAFLVGIQARDKERAEAALKKEKQLNMAEEARLKQAYAVIVQERDELRVKADVLTAVLHDVCPLACIERLDAWIAGPEP